MSCTISYRPLILSQYQLALFWSLHLSNPGAWIVRETSRVTAVLAGSNKCDRGGFDTPSSLGPPKVWRMEVDRGMWSQQFPGQPLSRVNYYTNQKPLPVMVSALMIHASFAHLAFFTLTWVLSCGASETLAEPCRFAPRVLILRSVTFCSVADETVIIWDNRGKKKKKKERQPKYVSHLFPACFMWS